MSTYEYTDTDGAELTVNSSPMEDGIYLGIFEGGPVNGVIVPCAETPALALAELLAAGWRRDESGRRGNIVRALAREISDSAAQAAREAEDAKVDEYRKTVDPDTNREWSQLMEVGRDRWRFQYRAAREFFTREEEVPDGAQVQ